MLIMEDARKTGLKSGLRQLTIEQLQRVINYQGEMVLDTFNYANGCYCPLAIGLGIDAWMVEPSHEKVFDELTARGYRVYNNGGAAAEIYTTERKRDLLEAAKEVVEEKTMTPEELKAERDDFIQRNAIALVEELESKIRRQSERIRLLEESNTSLRDELRKRPPAKEPA